MSIPCFLADKACPGPSESWDKLSSCATLLEEPPTTATSLLHLSAPDCSLALAA